MVVGYSISLSLTGLIFLQTKEQWHCPSTPPELFQVCCPCTLDDITCQPRLSWHSISFHRSQCCLHFNLRDTLNRSIYSISLLLSTFLRVLKCSFLTKIISPLQLLQFLWRFSWRSIIQQCLFSFSHLLCYSKTSSFCQLQSSAPHSLHLKTIPIQYTSSSLPLLRGILLIFDSLLHSGIPPPCLTFSSSSFRGLITYWFADIQHIALEFRPLAS